MPFHNLPQKVALVGRSAPQKKTMCSTNGVKWLKMTQNGKSLIKQKDKAPFTWIAPYKNFAPPKLSTASLPRARLPQQASPPPALPLNSAKTTESKLLHRTQIPLYPSLPQPVRPSFCPSNKIQSSDEPSALTILIPLMRRLESRDKYFLTAVQCVNFIVRRKQ